ncbi:MAG: DUF1080 domain-containing protein [Planctomycetes bacterium]|nr:DUF1080 domain-containing protein [Planctomycetota bacterium]
MKKSIKAIKIIVCLLLVATVLGVSSYAANAVKKYAVHDLERKNPPVINPARRFGQSPSDAIILFDGADLSEWRSDRGGGEAKWKIIDNNYMQVPKKAGGIHTLKEFGNCQLHVEWRTPTGLDPKITDQKRSNSGVSFMDRYEVQILDSYTDDNYETNVTYADGQAASIYGQHPPMVNACRKAGRWQSYDISFLRPLFDENGKCIRKARITVIHNGVVVHNNLDIEGTTSHKRKARYTSPHEKGHIKLQDHGNPMCFRNIWIRELPEEPYLIKD